MVDAEAVAEAAPRPTIRFVAVKSEAQQAAAMAHRSRDLLVRHCREPSMPCDQNCDLAKKIAVLDSELRKRASADATARWLTTTPALGVETAAAIATFAPPMGTFT